MTDTCGAISAQAFHPLADLFPLLEGAEFEELVADIREHGVHERIVVYRGLILDGRNRYRAALAAGVAYPTRIYEGDDPIGLVISRNLHRRHLSTSVRATIAAKLATMRQGERTDLPSFEGTLVSQVWDRHHRGPAEVHRISWEPNNEEAAS
jgi:hypothetical protein